MGGPGCSQEANQAPAFHGDQLILCQAEGKERGAEVRGKEPNLISFSRSDPQEGSRTSDGCCQEHLAPLSSFLGPYLPRLLWHQRNKCYIENFLPWANRGLKGPTLWVEEEAAKAEILDLAQRPTTEIPLACMWKRKDIFPRSGLSLCLRDPCPHLSFLHRDEEHSPNPAPAQAHRSV